MTIARHQTRSSGPAADALREAFHPIPHVRRIGPLDHLPHHAHSNMAWAQFLGKGP